MGIFEQLYNGEIFIAENSTPKTEEYKNASHRLSEASIALEDSLDENQKVLLEAYLAARADLESQIQINVFRQGTKFGFQLKTELTDETADDSSIGDETTK
ncbi:MAG: hypothetical protein PHV32_04390 [Eubacteriales bacterium]|nr:hypothetical protein [Eubacteriales bacterium]